MGVPRAELQLLSKSQFCDKFSSSYNKFCVIKNMELCHEVRFTVVKLGELVLMNVGKVQCIG